MRILIPIALLIAGAAVVDLNAQQKRELPWEKNPTRIGQALYRENCIVCHDIDIPNEKSIKQGPGFNQLFKQEAMPESGVPVTREFIKTMIRFGSGIMPAFQKKMTPAEMDLIIDYIASK